MSRLLDGSAARSRTRLLALSRDLERLLEQSGDWTKSKEGASRVAEILAVADKLLEEGRSINHLLCSYLDAWVSLGSMPTSGDLCVTTALTDDFRASAALVARAFDESGASGRAVLLCEISHPDSITENWQKDSVKKKKKQRKSRHLKPPGKVIGTLHGIQDLPQELLDLICDQVTGFRESKNLRLVAKCFAGRAAINVSILSGTLSFHMTSALFFLACIRSEGGSPLTRGIDIQDLGALSPSR